jgi:hypothetical protein
MMIYTGQELNKKFGGNFVFHIDSRGSVGRDGWADELHPKPRHFMRTGEAFVACIKNELPTYKNVFVVSQMFPS